MKKILFIISIIMSLFIISCSSENSSINTTNDKTYKLQDDFYEAVNYNTINSWQIKEDSNQTSVLSLLADNNYNIIQNIILSTYNCKDVVKNKDDYNITALYDTINNEIIRNKSNYGLLNEYLTKIDTANNIKELLSIRLECAKLYFCTSIMVIDITADIKDSAKYIYGSIVNTGLPKEIWQSTNSLYKDAYLEYLKKIMVLNGTSSI